jgi:hypothetical protein
MMEWEEHEKEKLKERKGKKGRRNMMVNMKDE